MASNGCGEDRMRELQCRNGQAALHLKFVALILIFFTSVLGISSPVLLARQFQGKPTYAKILLLIKCFAAGVILSTSLVHVLPEAFEALADCQIAAHHPWKNFPFSGFVAMLGALLALLVDIAATAHAHNEKEKPHYIPIRSEIQNPPNQQPGNNIKKPAGDEMELGASCHEAHRLDHHHYQQQQQLQQVDDQLSQLKERLVSQVLEIGIVFHSVIIGVTMGMSQNQCTIRPLVAALAFHQIFEGMGLGGCIAQAGFNVGTTIYMCLLFSVTTPVGIVVGMLVFFATGYDDSSPNALIWEGLLGSLCSGILIYMALVDLIAVDFFHNKKMSCNLWMKKVCYIALLLGSASMSILALWA